MKLEIERKAWVVDPEGLRRELEARCGQPRESIKLDRYFIEPDAKPGADGGMDEGEEARGREEDWGRGGALPRVARLRREGPLGIVTAKRRSLVLNSEINREFEFVVDDPDAFEEFVREYLGYRVLADKTKHTWKFKDHPLTLELSELKTLGWFFEVEYMAADEAERDAAFALLDETFARYRRFLGDVEPRQYIRLLMSGAHGPIQVG